MFNAISFKTLFAAVLVQLSLYPEVERSLLLALLEMCSIASLREYHPSVHRKLTACFRFSGCHSSAGFKDSYSLC